MLHIQTKYSSCMMFWILQNVKHGTMNTYHQVYGFQVKVRQSLKYKRVITRQKISLTFSFSKPMSEGNTEYAVLHFQINEPRFILR